MSNKFKHVLVGLFLSLAFFQCADDIKLPANKIEFESSVAGIAVEETSLPININLSRTTSSDVILSISVVASGLQYGTDFTTTPEATNNTIQVTIPAGETQAEIVLAKVAGVGFTGDESVVFTISEVVGSPVVGEVPQITVTFSEITVSTGTMNIQGGGPTFPNKVFIDLSANRQTAVNRTAWNFGFSSGEDFRVILNSSVGMMARALDKTDMTTVTAADTLGFGDQLSLAAVFAAIMSDPVPDWVPTAVTWIDSPTGSLSTTAFAAVSETASENKVYIVNLGDGIGSPAPNLGWKKVRVLRNGNGYTLQHADINSLTFSEIQIAKDATHAFQYVSLANGSVEVEPATGKWDIAWTGFTNSTNFGSGPVPYYFQDMILQNTTGVQTAQVLTSTKAYADFSAADLEAFDFGAQTQIKIGSSWRSSGGPGSAPALKTDRFYVIKDAAGNIYKLRFTALTQDGERGRPAIEFALLN